MAYCFREIFYANEDNLHHTQNFCGCLKIIRSNNNLSLINMERYTEDTSIIHRHKIEKQEMVNNDFIVL